MLAPDGGATERQSAQRLVRNRPRCDSSAAAARWPTPRPWSGRTRSPTARARCSIRSSASASTVILEPERDRRRSISSPASPKRARLRIALIEKYHDRHLADRVFDLAWTHSQIVAAPAQRHRGRCQLYGRLAGSIIYANASLRARRRHADPQSARAIRPVGLRHFRRPADRAAADRATTANIDLVRQLVQAHAYWRLKGLAVDLVIWNEDDSVYRQMLQDAIMDLIAAGIEAHVLDKPGGIFVRRARADVRRGPDSAAIRRARRPDR